MGEIKDKNGIPIAVGDSIRIGNNRYAFVCKIEGFTMMNDGRDLMVKTNMGDFNIDLVEKCV